MRGRSRRLLTPRPPKKLSAAPLTRRAFGAALAGVALAPRALHANGFGQMLWEYTLAYIEALDERRRQRFEAIQTAEDLARLREDVRAGLAEMWGPFPAERSALNAQVTGVLERDDFVVEKIVFESRPKFYVTANLYRPKQVEGRLPAALVPCGHSAEGKAAESYQRFGILLARSGFIAFVWDPIGQGERLQLLDPATGQPLAGVGTAEHRALGHQSWLVGLNLMNYRAWDASRAIDYLETRPDVDAERIVMGGVSGGGMETLQYAPFEPRLRAAFPACAAASFKAKTEAHLIADPEQVLFGTLRRGIDHPELLAAFAPKPLLIGAAIQDYVPIEAARRTHEAVQRVYDLAGVPQLEGLAETDAGHGLNQELREAGADWFSRWVAETSRRIKEKDAPVAAPEELRATATGQVETAFDGVTVADCNLKRGGAIRPQRAVPRNDSEFRLYKSEIQHQIQAIARVGSFKPERGIFIPDRTIQAGVYSRGAAVIVAEAGKDDPTVRRSVIDPAVAANFDVTALDLRGWGETKPAMPDAERDVDWERFFAYRALEIGKPLLGQRIKDLLATAPGRVRRRTWTVIGVGAGALVAAHAAVLDPRIEAVIAVAPPLSYWSLLEDPLTTHPFSSFLPGVIGAYDVRDLFAAVAPRRVLVLNPLDSRRAPVNEVRAWEEYDWVSQAYEAVASPDAFELKTGLDTAMMRDAIFEWLKT